MLLIFNDFDEANACIDALKARMMQFTLKCFGRHEYHVEWSI